LIAHNLTKYHLMKKMRSDLTHIQIEVKIISFLKTEIYDASIQLNRQTNLIESGMDSFSLLSLLMFIEKTFNIVIPQEEINETRMKSVQNLADLIYDLTR